jgi:hypothetical protein
MTNTEALAVLDHAVRRCTTEDIRTPDVDAALAHLELKASAAWPFAQFRHALEAEGTLTADREGRRQVVNASVNAIRRVCAHP